MSNYDRFKPTSVAQTKERKQEVNQAVYENDNNQDGKIKKLNVKKDGTYKIRQYPAHPVEDGKEQGLSIEPKVNYFLPAWRKKKDPNNGQYLKDNKGAEIMELYNRPIYDARIHGGAPFDLVDTFTGIAKRQAATLYGENKEQQKTYLAPILGNKFTGGTFNGIPPQKTFIFYGDLYTGEGEKETKTFYEFEVGKAIEKGIQSTAAIENDNDPLGTDACFTDVLTGLPMKILVDSVSARSANDNTLWYKVSLVKDSVKEVIGGRTVQVVREYPLTEEELDWFEAEVPPLTVYRTIFTRKDLENQLSGLRIFDEEHKFNILETDEFKDVWNILDKFFPVTEENQNSNEGGNGTATKQASEDEFDLMNLAELKAFIKDNKLGFVVLPSMTEDQVKEMIRLTLSGTDTEASEEVEETIGEADDTINLTEEPNEPVEDEPHVATIEEAHEGAEETKSNKPSSYKDRIAGLANKTN